MKNRRIEGHPERIPGPHGSVTKMQGRVLSVGYLSIKYIVEIRQFQVELSADLWAFSH